MDTVSNIIRYENGELSDEEVIEFFQEMINDGTVWHLQGSYQGQAIRLIHLGWCKMPGEEE